MTSDFRLDNLERILAEMTRERDEALVELREAVELLQDWEYECDYSEFGQMLVDTRKFLTRPRDRPLPGVDDDQ